MLMPLIDRYMKRQPQTIHADARLAAAGELMRESGIRHLPVLRDGKLVGVVSQRDLYRLERLRYLESNFTVKDAMKENVFTVLAETPVDDVVEAMAEHKYGSAVIVDRDQTILGIFTTTDGMQVLADVLRRATA